MSPGAEVLHLVVESTGHDAEAAHAAFHQARMSRSGLGPSAFTMPIPEKAPRCVRMLSSMYELSTR